MKRLGTLRSLGLALLAAGALTLLTALDALDALNQSEDCRPAAIGIDVLYTGESTQDLDAWLAESAGQYGNVVTACAAQFGTALAEDGNGGYYLDDFSVLAFEEPYAALRDATTQGHINAMLDTDGVLRHHMLKLRLPDGTEVPSMALALAQMYYDYCGLGQVALPPVDARNFWYVPFCGEPGDFDESISVVDLISGEISADYFAGKIVLIGPFTIGLNAPGGTIYISRAVADALEGRIRTTSLGDTIKLKGKKDGFEILTMDGIL